MDGGMMDGMGGMMHGAGLVPAPGGARPRGRGLGEVLVLQRPQMSRKAVALGIVAALSGAVALALIWRLGASPGEAAAIAQGRQLYAENCASCHGAKLEGQPDWKKLLPSGRMPAPPHDASGHTWHHPDGVLFRITKEGPAVVVGGGYESDMPGFRDTLSDKEIRAVLAFIKSAWPERERAYQTEMSRRERETLQ